uniref:G_PROTEIN_RECEP_F1_2 domain-containing protein n=1 Tax=Steinernema glaseri TaxID=37863 RepID=A0A1I7XXY4_9BILA
MSLLDMTSHPAYLVTKSIIAAFTIAGNSFIVFTVLRLPKLRHEKFNLLIILLAMGDFVIGVNVPFSLSLAFADEASWTGLFMTSQVLVTFGDHVTQIAMLLVAADRMYVLLTLRKLEKNVYAASIPVVLTVSLIPVCFFLVQSDTVIAAVRGEIDAYSSTFVYYMTVIMFVFNFSILGLYAAVAVAYRIQMRKTSVSNSAQNAFNKVVLGIVLIYFFMWCIPKWLNFCVVTAQVEGLLFDVALILPEECALFSAALNVFLYGYTHRDLKTEMTRCFRRITKTQKKSYVESNICRDHGPKCQAPQRQHISKAFIHKTRKNQAKEGSALEEVGGQQDLLRVLSGNVEVLGPLILSVDVAVLQVAADDLQDLLPDGQGGGGLRRLLVDRRACPSGCPNARHGPFPGRLSLLRR